MKYSIIIAGFNEEANIGNCLHSCQKLNYPAHDYEIIYVDNDSSDKSFFIAQQFERVKVLLEKRKGPSEARNTGIRVSNGQICLFLDADATISNNYLEEMDTVYADESINACGAKVLPIKKTWISQYLGVSILERYPRMKKKEFVRNHPSCNLAIKKDVLDSIGYFIEGSVIRDRLMHRSEDKELCMRLHDNGYKIYYTPNTHIRHKNRSDFFSLLRVLVKSKETRIAAINNNDKDFLTTVFRYHFPILAITFCLLSFIISLKLGLSVFIFFSLGIFFISGFSLYSTGLFFESIFIKPWMDPFTILFVDVNIILTQIKRFLFK